MRVGWCGAALAMCWMMAGAAWAAPSGADTPAAKPAASAGALDFTISDWASVEQRGSQLIRRDNVGKALTEPAHDEWEEITVFAHKKNRNRELAYERAHAADAGYEPGNSDLASPSIKPPPALSLFSLPF